MKKRCLGVLLLLTTILGGCGAAGQNAQAGSAGIGEGVAGYENSAVKDTPAFEEGEKEKAGAEYVPPEMKGEVTISTMYEMEFLSVAAKRFMKQYPDVIITINTCEGTGGANADNDYRTWLNTKIMSGNVEDIIFTTWIPVKKYMDMGVFVDLSDFLSATPQMNEENYFMNVIESARDDEGRLFIMPCASSLMVLSFDGELAADIGQLGEAGSVRFSEAAACAKPLVDKSSVQNTFLSQDSGMTYMNALIEEYYSTLVTDEGNVNINTPEYINMLLETEKLLKQGYFEVDNDIDYYNMEYCFIMNTDVDMQSAFYNLTGDNCLGMPVADGEGNVCTGSQFCFGITESSRNKELAWEFMKYVLSDEIQSSPSVPGLAVNRKGFEASAKKYLTVYTEGTGASVSLEDYKGLLEQWVNKINKCNIKDPVITQYFFEENTKFFDGLQSAEQTAQILQNKVTQYLNE